MCLRIKKIQTVIGTNFKKSVESDSEKTEYEDTDFEEVPDDSVSESTKKKIDNVNHRAKILAGIIGQVPMGISQRQIRQPQFNNTTNTRKSLFEIDRSTRRALERKGYAYCRVCSCRVMAEDFRRHMNFHFVERRHRNEKGVKI